MANKPKILFVTGTDTGVGKTTVSCALVSALAGRGIDVDVAKPVETGCLKDERGELVPEDGVRLHEASGRRSALAEVVPLRFAVPAAPTVAAAAVGEQINTGELVSFLRRRAQGCRLLVVEGAGGLLVPIAYNFSFADLAAALEATTLVVVGSKLGAINHAALTFEVLKGRALPAAGYVLNECFPPQAAGQAALATNRDEIRTVLSYYGAEELGYIEHFSAKSSISPSGLFLGGSAITDLAATVAHRLGL